MKTWADLHGKPERIFLDADEEPKDETRGKKVFFGESVYKKKKTKFHVFDECAVRNDPYKWQKKILEIMPEYKYSLFQKIFNLPPIEDREGPDRKYSLYDLVPKKFRRHSIHSTLSPTMEESSLSEQIDLPRGASKITVLSDDLFATEMSRTYLRSKPLSPRRREGRIFKWKMAWLKAKQEGDLVIFDDLFVNPPTRPGTPPKDILEDLRTPYQKFLTKTNEEVASTWRKTEGPPPFAEMTLEEQGDAATEQVAREFVQWMHEKAGFTDCPINVDMLRDMFRVNLSSQALKCLKVEMKELAAVPDNIAKIYNMPEMSERAALHRQIIWDSYYEKKPRRKVAFGKTIPNQPKKCTKDTKALWFNSEVVPPDLQSGAVLWNDLRGTNVLDKFCEWLLENPKYARPNYLITSGYLKEIEKKLRGGGETRSFHKIAKDRKRAKICLSYKLKKVNEDIGSQLKKLKL